MKTTISPNGHRSTWNLSIIYITYLYIRYVKLINREKQNNMDILQLSSCSIYLWRYDHILSTLIFPKHPVMNFTPVYLFPSQIINPMVSKTGIDFTSLLVSIEIGKNNEQVKNKSTKISSTRPWQETNTYSNNSITTTICELKHLHLG